MKKAFDLYDRFAWWLDLGTKYFIVGLTTFMFLVVMAQVIFNYGFKSGLSWSEELSKLLLAWLTFIGASLVSRRYLHIGLDAVVNRLPHRPRHLVKMGGLIVALCFLYALTIWGWRLAVFGQAQSSNYLNVSYFWFYLGIPLGGLLTFLQTLYLLIVEIQVYSNPQMDPKIGQGEQPLVEH